MAESTPEPMAELPAESTPEDLAQSAPDPTAEATPVPEAQSTADPLAEMMPTLPPFGAADEPQDSVLPDAIEAQFASLPTYARGLLRITVPVTVTLAAQRKSIQEIIELGPGSIVKFDKTCDEPLELTVGDRPIATGEVVKVGDKFGLRIGAPR